MSTTVHTASEKKAPHQQRSEETRDALIGAGLELFGENGFNATTTRMVASRAGANIAAIPYYFGGKKGLYHAVVEHIMMRADSHLGETRTAIMAQMQAEELNKTQALSALQQLIASFASLFVESDEPKAWAQLIMREQAKPSDAFDLLYDGHIAQVQEIFTQLIAARLGIAGDSDEAKLRGHALFGQILIFIVSRESVLRHLGVAQLEPKHVRLIHALLMAHAEGALSVALPEEVRGDA